MMMITIHTYTNLEPMNIYHSPLRPQPLSAAHLFKQESEYKVLYPVFSKHSLMKE